MNFPLKIAERDFLFDYSVESYKSTNMKKQDTLNSNDFVYSYWRVEAIDS